MRANDAEAPRGLMTERREALDAIPADEPRNYLRPSLQLLVRWWSGCTSACRPWRHSWRPWSPEVAD